MRYALLLMTLFAALSACADLLLVANRGGSTITLIDPATMTSLGTVPVGPDPHEIALSADGKRAYVSNYAGGNGNSLSIVDLETRTKVKDVPISPLQAPHGIVERNGKIWFTAEDSNAVGRYDPVADRVDWVGRTNQIGTHMLAVNGDGTRVYTANIGSGTVSIIPVGSGAEDVASKTLTATAQSEGIALSPDEREVWAGSAGSDGIAIIDTASETRVAKIAAGTFAYRLTFLPDGRTALVPRAPEGVVAVYDVATRAELRTIPVGGAPLSIVVSPGGGTAYVAMVQPSRVVKLDLATGQITGSVVLSGAPDGLALRVDPPAEPQGKKRRSVRTRG